MSIRVGVVGATGLLGQELVAALAEAAREERLELEPPVLLATSRAEGETVAWLEEDEELVIEPFSAEAIRGLQFAIVAVPAAEVAKVTDVLRKQGVRFVDASRTHRAAAPLFFEAKPVPVVGQAVVALPSPEALLLARVLAALSGLEPVRASATVLRPASAAGQAGVGDLAESTGRLLNGQEPETPVLGHRLAFNVVPQAGPFEGPDAEGERDLEAETRRLLGRAQLPVVSTIAWGPWFHGHFAALELEFAGPVSVDAARGAFERAGLVKLVDRPEEAVYPMPLLATGDEGVLVGRLRGDRADPRRLALVAAIDGLRATAVLAVEAVAAMAGAQDVH